MLLWIFKFVLIKIVQLRVTRERLFSDECHPKIFDWYDRNDKQVLWIVSNLKNYEENDLAVNLYSASYTLCNVTCHIQNTLVLMYLEWLQTNRQSISKRNVRDKIWSFIMLCVEDNLSRILRILQYLITC